MATTLTVGTGTVNLSNGNLTATIKDEASCAVSNTYKCTGKWCYEVTYTGGNITIYGICAQDASFTPIYTEQTPNSLSFWGSPGKSFPSNSTWDDGGYLTNNCKVLFAIDVDAKTLKYKIGNGVWSSAKTWSFTSAVKAFLCNQSGSPGSITANFGATAFNSPMPDGYLAWDDDVGANGYYRQII